MIYSARAQSEVNESHFHEVPYKTGGIFHMGKVSELWRKTMVNNSPVFNLRNCSVILVGLVIFG